jgi:Bacterial Ig-like domain (group 3)
MSIERGARGGLPILGRLSAAPAAVVLALFTGITGHALSVSTTTLTAGTNPTVWGQSVTFTATITPGAPAPTRTVTFKDGGINIATCVGRPVAARIATCTTSTLAFTSHTITAVYSGDGTYAGSTSAAVVQVVNKGTTASVVTSSANPSVPGQTATYTTTVTATPPSSGARTGTVNFQDAGVTIVGCGARAVAAAGTATCAIAYAGPGIHLVTGVYSGDTNFLTSTSAVRTQTVGQGSTGSAVTSSANPSASGQTVTYTTRVTATAPASGTRSGTVDFQEAGVTIVGCSAKAVALAGTATCAVAYAGPGSHRITATYSGDANFAASTSAALTQTVRPGSTGTAVASSLNPSSTGASVTFTARVTVTSPASGVRTGSVNFEDAGTTIAGCGAKGVAVAGTATCATSALGAGLHTITAVYSGDTNFAPSTSAAFTQRVINATSTTVTSSVNPSVFGQSVQYRASIAGGPVAGGSVTFRDGGVNVSGCVAVLMTAGAASCTASPTVGAHAITAVYSGDASHAASTSAGVTQTVNADPTSTTITSTAAPSVFGQSVTLTATVTANGPGAGTPGGTVAFKDGGASIGGCTNVAMAAGVATCTTTMLMVAAHPTTAVYNGSATFTKSTSAVFTQTVTRGATATVVTSATNPSLTGQVMVLTATMGATAPAAGAPSGTVTFLDAGGTIAGCGARAIAVGTATCTTSLGTAGPHAITAVYSGDTRFLTSTSAALTQVVNRGATSSVVTSSVNPSVSGQGLTYTAAVTASAPASGTPTGTAAFNDAGLTIAGCGAQPLVAGIASCSVGYAAVGTHTITATYSGDADFLSSTAPVLTQSVNPAATTTALTSSVNPSVSGQGLTYTAAVTTSAPASGTPTGTAAFNDAGLTIAGCGAQPLVAGIASCSLVYVGAGARTITVTYSGDANFLISTSTAMTQVVNRGVAASTVLSSVSPSLSGHTVLYTVTVTPAAPSSGTPTGTVTFDDGGSPIASCDGQVLTRGVTVCSLTYPAAGTHDITAHYGGDSNFGPSVSPVVTVLVAAGGVAAVSVTPAIPQVGVGLSGGAIALLLAGLTAVLIGRRRCA